MNHNVIVKKSKRKTLSINILENGDVEVRSPKGLSEEVINEYLEKHRKWIDKKVSLRLEKNEKLKEYNYSENEIKHLKKEARQKISYKVEKYSKLMGVKYNKIRLSGAKKRWGSCSNKKTVSISWRLIFAPDEIMDYVVIHELAHIKHMNHSKKYWKLVSEFDPDYKKHRNWLKENDYLLSVGIKN